MARRNIRYEADDEIDFHGYTAMRMRQELDLRWGRGRWHGVRSVRVIHGGGAVLGPELHRWCHEKGIEFMLEAHQGSTVLYPGQRSQVAPFEPHRPLASLRTIRQNRRIAEPSPEPGAPASAKDHPPAGARDLMAEEMDRLAGEDPRETRRRKLTGP